MRYSTSSSQALFSLLSLVVFTICPASAWTFAALSSRTNGLAVDAESCGPYAHKIVNTFEAARSFVNAAFAATANPTVDPYFYFFKTKWQQQVRDTYDRMGQAIYGQGPLIPFYCNETYSMDGDYDCGGDDETVIAWAIGTATAPHIVNFCPWALRSVPAFPNQCRLPPEPYFLSAQEQWPAINNQWLEHNTLAEIVIHELSHLPEIIGRENGASDSPLYTTVYAAHALAHAEDVQFFAESGENMTEIMSTYNWEFMAKESWRSAEAIKNKSPTRQKWCAERRKVRHDLFKDELKHRRRLTLIPDEP